jgi:alginate O-acetyltransferase complex protein AlgI
MLFNSFEFILGFLPVVLGGYWLLARYQAARLWFLLGASLVFYGYWDWRFSPLLIGSICLNWLAAELYFARAWRGMLVGAIVADLLCLGAFKYLGFFDAIVTDATGWQLSLPRLALPLGISFFTFHHIIYLVDLLRGNAPRYRFRDYALYIALFPQILAGPLVRHREIVPQFALAPGRSGWDARLAQGIGLFVIGLAKKLLLADPLRSHADPIFAKAAAGAVSIGDAWTAALAFPLQIYFDFSGYSDMAIGLALMFGIALPFNFDVPYRAASLREFWRRWHMTLSRFLRDYLYIPLGGNRHGLPRQIWALMATFLLGGLWHGAGWAFIAWGGLHGAGLTAGVLWRRWLPPLPRPMSWLALMLFLIVTWVFFRAPSLYAAGNVLTAMAGHGSRAPVEGLRTIALAAAVAFIGPSSQEFVARLEARRWVALAGAAATAALLLKLGDAPSYEFIYFHF